VELNAVKAPRLIGDGGEGRVRRRRDRVKPLRQAVDPVAMAHPDALKMADLADKGAIVLPLDITKQDQIEAVAARIVEGHGGVDVLVNNAGYGQYGPIEDTPVETARYQFEVNLFGLARLTQLLLPAMRDKRQGMIVNISSIGGKLFTAPGITRPNTRLKAGPTVCDWN